jgi:PKHD-type hydroxylase
MKVFNVLDANKADEIRNLVTDLGWIDGKLSARGSAKDIKKNEQIMSADPKFAPIVTQLEALFLSDTTLKGYCFPSHLVGVRANSYSVGEYYDWHVDMAHMNGKQTDMSFTLFLTDPADYEGGDLEAKYGTHKVKVKGKKGQMVIYPTGVLHRVTEVTRGRRICIVGWVESLIKEQDDRDVLFNLGLELTKLRKLVTNPKDFEGMNYCMQQLLRRLSR